MATTPLTRFRKAARRFRKAEDDLAAARRELRAAMLDARAAGVTMQVLADEMGVTRQRIAALIADAEKNR